MTKPALSENGSYRAQVTLRDIGVAPENLRFGQPADAGIPQLAETLAVDQIMDVICRPGKKGEKPYMALDGRRRLYAFEHLLKNNRITEDHLVWVTVETDLGRQARATVLTGTEKLQTHVADVIECIGRLQSKRLTIASIASFLGYEKLEVERLAKLADLPSEAFQAMRDGRLTQKQAKLLTRIKDADTQKQLVAQAVQGSLTEDSLQRLANGSHITTADKRFRLVGAAAYAAAGGRTETDLFGMTEDLLLDSEVLTKVWFERAKPAATALRDAGLNVLASMDRQFSAPEGYVTLPLDSRTFHTPEQATAFAAALQAVQQHHATLYEMEAFSDDNLDLLRDYALAQLEAARALHPRVTIGCAAVSPDHDFGIDLVFFANPAAPEVEDPAPEATADAIAEGAPSPAEPPPAPVASAHIEIGASTNALHERYTDVATRGLIRAVSEDPNAALSLIIARLFSTIALGGDPQSASTIQATTYTKPGADPIEALDGVVRAKVAEQVKAFNDSGLTVLAWIDALPRSEKMELMAALTALTLNARETGPNHTRPRARAEAAELAEMTGYDIVNYWTPNVEFFAAHRRADLVGILDRMGAGDAPASDLKQGDLAVHVAEQAAERVWAPDALSWRQAAAPANALSPDIDDLAA